MDHAFLLALTMSSQRIAADSAAASQRDDPSALLAAKARRYAAMSSGGVGGAVGDAELFLVDFEQKRYDEDVSEREVDALAAAASSDNPCPLRSELELHAANQSSQAAAARKQRDAALQVCFCFFCVALCSTDIGSLQARLAKRAASRGSNT